MAPVPSSGGRGEGGLVNPEGGLLLLPPFPSTHPPQDRPQAPLPTFPLLLRAGLCRLGLSHSLLRAIRAAILDPSASLPPVLTEPRPGLEREEHPGNRHLPLTEAGLPASGHPPTQRPTSLTSSPLFSFPAALKPPLSPFLMLEQR